MKQLSQAPQRHQRLHGRRTGDALAGADAVIDVSNMMSFDEAVITDFFRSSSMNLTSAEKPAGVRHHVVLSIVNADQLADNLTWRQGWRKRRPPRAWAKGTHRPRDAVP